MTDAGRRCEGNAYPSVFKMALHILRKSGCCFCGKKKLTDPKVLLHLFTMDARRYVVARISDKIGEKTAHS